MYSPKPVRLNDDDGDVMASQATHVDGVSLHVADADSDDFESFSHPSPQRRCLRPSAIFYVFALVAAAIGVAVVILVVSESSASKIKVPHTFTASFSSQTTSGYGGILTATNNSMVSGSLHKTTNANGDWLLSGVAEIRSHAGQVTRVTVVDNRAFIEVFEAANYPGNNPTTQGCARQDTLDAVPGLGDVVTGSVKLEDNQVVAGAANWCSGVARFAFRTLDRDYVVCFTSSGDVELASHGFVAHLRDIDSAVSTITPFTIPTNVSTSQPLSCPQLVVDDDGAIVKASRRRLEGGEEGGGAFPPPTFNDFRRRRLASVRRRLPEERDRDGNTEPMAMGSGHTCVFVHGVGVSGSAPVSETPQPVNYWGDGVLESARVCDATQFIHFDTAANEWDSATLATEFCNVAAPSGEVPDTTIVIAHGMGNLVVANALKTNECTMHSGASWIELQSGFNMGRLTNFVTNFCKQYSTMASWVSWVETLQADLGMCEPGTTTISRGWSSLGYDHAGFTAEIETIIDGKVTATACGNVPEGLMGSSYYNVIAEAVQDTSAPANAVAWSRCWMSKYESSFVSTPDTPFYAAAVNSWDLTGRNGCGVSGADQVPLEWLAYAIEASTQ